MEFPAYVKKDPYLKNYIEPIIGRWERTNKKESELTQNEKELSDFAVGYLFYGLHKEKNRWVMREWAPNATDIFLFGEFSDWQIKDEYRFVSIGEGNWELTLPLETLHHLDLYKLHIKWHGGRGNRIPAWAKRVVQDPVSQDFNAQIWDPENPYVFKYPKPRKDEKFSPLIYEAHVGMATEEYETGTFKDFTEKILPGIKKSGYNTIQLMAIQEHPFYGSFGYHVSSFFAASSRFGTPDELKELIDEAHKMGLFVIMDIVHSHAVKNEVEGISRYDGTLYQFFHNGSRGDHPAWDSRCFDYGKNQVLHFLLSNCKYWIEEYNFDGYRFDGVTSMLYNDHGLGSAFTEYGQYYNGNQDDDAIVYLKLANKLIHQVYTDAITVAEEMSGMPGIATSQQEGGYGFDYRLAMGIPDYWIKTIKEKPIEQWSVGDMFYNLSNKREDEKTIHYAESHDQALVGDKTLIFWLMDKEMYYNMHVNHQNIIVENGIALHKMIRLLTITTAGNGYLNFMGNEFGHPEWIDFPNVHNNWSYHYARRQWSLVRNENLRYQFLNMFDKEMIKFVKKRNLIHKKLHYTRVQNEGDQVLIFERGKFLLVFNFNPFNSYTGYSFECIPGKYKYILNSDDSKFGGYDRLNNETIHFSHKDAKGKEVLSLYIPSLSAFVLERY